MNDSGDGMRQKIEDWFKLHADEMIKDLGRMLSVKSVKGLPEKGAPYGSGPRDGLAMARSMLEERGFTVSEFENIVITANTGPEPAKMGILAHVDVVDAGDGWDTDPFNMTIKDDRIYGRGALDNKGPTIAAMYAMYCVRELLPDMKSGFQLILGSGEELGCGDIVQYLEKNEPPTYVFTPDAGYPVVNTEKGRAAVFIGASWEDEDQELPRVISITGGKTMNVVPDHAEALIEGFRMDQLETYCMISSAQTGTNITVNATEDGIIIAVEGKSTHAATPDLGVNAQTALIDMLASMPFAESKGNGYIRALNRLFPHGDNKGKALGIEMSDDKTGALTVNFGVLRYTGKEFLCNFDSRTPACADETDLLAMIGAALEREGLKITNSVLSKCHHTPEDSPFVQTLLKIYSEYTGNPAECLTMGGQTYVHEIPGGVAFGCELPGTDNKIHSANEFIGVEQLIISAEMFAQAIVEICGVS